VNVHSFPSEQDILVESTEQYFAVRGAKNRIGSLAIVIHSDRFCAITPFLDIFLLFGSKQA